MRTRGDFRRSQGGQCRGQRHIVCSCQTGPKGQEGVSEFNLITREGPAEPVELFIQPTVCETKENVNSGARIMENPPNIPAVAPKFFVLCCMMSPIKLRLSLYLISYHLARIKSAVVQQKVFTQRKHFTLMTFGCCSLCNSTISFCNLEETSSRQPDGS